jgi:hypothetical protein
LNQAELEIGLFARQCLGQRRIPDFATLTAETRAWNRQINRKRTLINWNFSPAMTPATSSTTRTTSLPGQSTSGFSSFRRILRAFRPWNE